MGRRIMGKTSAERQRWKTEAEEGWSVWGVQELRNRVPGSTQEESHV